MATTLTLTRRLFQAGLVLTLVAGLVILLGPQQGLEALGGFLLAYLVLLYHVALGPILVLEVVRQRRVGPGLAAMLAYVCVIYAVGLYVWVVTSDIDDALQGQFVALSDRDGHRVRELAAELRRQVVRDGHAAPRLRDELAGLVESGAELNRREPRLHPALWYLAAIGDRELVDLLLDKGAVTDDPALYGTPPLVQALQYGHGDTALRLLQAGADADARDHAGRPALVLAAQQGDLDAVEALLEAGADVNATHYDGGAFSVALDRGDTAMVALLLSRGASAELSRDRLAIAAAVDSGDPGLLQVLLDHGVTFEQRNARHDPLLFQAAAACDPGAMRRYLALGASPEVQNRRGDWLGHRLVRLDTAACDLDRVRSDMLAALLDAGLDPDQVDARGVPLLMAALSAGRTESARQLVAAGARLDVSQHQRTPLMLAAGLGLHDVVDAALGAGADIDAWPPGANTVSALYLAVRAGRADTVAYLLQRGATLPAEPARLRNLFRFAAEHRAMLERLLAQYQGVERSEAMDRAVRRGVDASNNPASRALLQQSGL